jgi:hypothetical protein
MMVNADPMGNIYFYVTEVNYDEDGLPICYGKAETLSCNTIGGIFFIHKKMKSAFKKPILWAGDKFPNEYTTT